MAQQQPLVSVLVPAYKDKFLKQLLTSLTEQDYQNLNIVVVDDASPYNLNSIISEFNHPNISCYRNSHNIGGKNLVANWNSLLKHTGNADLIVLASDDDLYEPQFISTLVSLSLKYPEVDLFHCRTGVIDDDGNPIFWSPSIAEYESDIDFIYQRAINRRTQLISDFMFRREAIQRIGGFTDYPKAWYADEMTLYKLARGKGVVCAQKTLFYWRSSQLNISSQSNDINDKALAADLHIERMTEFIKTLKPKSLLDEYLLSDLKARYCSIIEKQLIYDLIRIPFIKAFKIARKHGNHFRIKWSLMLIENRIRSLFNKNHRKK